MPFANVFCIALLVLSSFSGVCGQARCNTAYWPALGQGYAATNNFASGLVSIPVIVHVVWFAPEENISDAQDQLSDRGVEPGF
jgi:hypothetical protein